MTHAEAQAAPAYRVALRTNVGLVRDNNEDSLGKAWLDDGSLLVVVCDGMGGHAAGEVASNLAVDVVREVMTRDPAQDPRERLVSALVEANDVIAAEGSGTGVRRMGTTAVAVLCRGDEAFVGQVGDSRVYHLRKGHVMWRTRDHTRVQDMVDRGEINATEARTHPDAGMLTRALGHKKMANGEPLRPDVPPDALRLGAGDTVLLCSDGLHDLMDDVEIGRVIAGQTPDAAADALIDLALQRGGHDNVTVALICVGDRAAAFDATFRTARTDGDTFDHEDGARPSEASRQPAPAMVPVSEAESPPAFDPLAWLIGAAIVMALAGVGLLLLSAL